MLVNNYQIVYRAPQSIALASLKPSSGAQREAGSEDGRGWRITNKENQMPHQQTRAEHLQWAKDRALKYVKADDLNNAYASMVSDLNKHPETQGHSGIQLGMMLMMGGQLSTPQKMRDFIEGFN